MRRTPMGPQGEGLWLPCGVNEMLKIGKYKPGCLFKAHRDGPFVPSNNEISVLTVVIYLYASTLYASDNPSQRSFSSVAIPSRSFHFLLLMKLIYRNGESGGYYRHLPVMGGNTRFLSDTVWTSP